MSRETDPADRRRRSSPALAGAAVAVVAARDAVYWERPLPGVAVARVVAGRRDRGLDVRRQAVLGRPADACFASTRRRPQRAATQRGRDSFLTPGSRARRPDARRRCAWIPCSFRRRPARRDCPAWSGRCPKRGGHRSRRPSASSPSRPGERIDRAGVPGGSAAAVARRRALACRAAPARRAGAADAAAEEAARRGAGLVAAPVALSFQGQDVGTLAAGAARRSLSASAPTATASGSRSRRTGSRRRSSRTLAKWRQRAVNARFVVDGRECGSCPSRPGLAPDAAGRGLAHRCRLLVDPARLAAPASRHAPT